MPLFMDKHHGIAGLTKEAVVGTARRDPEVDERLDVKYLQYWFNEQRGGVFCADVKEGVQCSAR